MQEYISLNTFAHLAIVGLALIAVWPSRKGK